MKTTSKFMTNSKVKMIWPYKYNMTTYLKLAVMRSIIIMNDCSLQVILAYQSLFAYSYRKALGKGTPSFCCLLLGSCSCWAQARLLKFKCHNLTKRQIRRYLLKLKQWPLKFSENAGVQTYARANMLVFYGVPYWQINYCDPSCLLFICIWARSGVWQNCFKAELVLTKPCYE